MRERRGKASTPILVFIAALASVAVLSGTSSSGSRAASHASAFNCAVSGVPLKPPPLPRAIVRIGKDYRGSQATMPKSKIRRTLAVVWHRLYNQCNHQKLSHRKLRYRISGNLRQIESDSGFRPAARSPIGQHAEGLFQLIDPVFRHWHLPGHKSVVNPVDDILASVNIQLEADTVVSVYEPGYVFPHNVLNGRHRGWGFHGGDNPYRPFR
jgi:hypothetical protein